MISPVSQEARLAKNTKTRVQMLGAGSKNSISRRELYLFVGPLRHRVYRRISQVSNSKIGAAESREWRWCWIGSIRHDSFHGIEIFSSDVAYGIFCVFVCEEGAAAATTWSCCCASATLYARGSCCCDETSSSTSAAIETQAEACGAICGCVIRLCGAG